MNTHDIKNIPPRLLCWMSDALMYSLYIAPDTAYGYDELTNHLSGSYHS
jgi:hypothetical protein